MSSEVQKFMGFVEKCFTNPETGIKEKGPGVLCWIVIVCCILCTFSSFLWLFTDMREKGLEISEALLEDAGKKDEYYRTKVLVNDIINIIINIVSIFIIYKCCVLCRPSLIILFCIVWSMITSTFNMIVTGNIFSRY